MNKLLTILILTILPFCAFGQQKQSKHPTPLAKFEKNVELPLSAKERQQIIDVYGEFANEYVFNNKNRLKTIKQILRNRVIIKQITDDKDKKPCPKLSEVPLFNKYVPELERDQNFNPQDFNPLKYNFQFYSVGAYMYQVDNTNYYIIIKSQHQ